MTFDEILFNPLIAIFKGGYIKNPFTVPIVNFYYAYDEKFFIISKCHD